MHNKVETLKLQMQESLQSTFVVAWPMIEMKNDSDARVRSIYLICNRKLS